MLWAGLFLVLSVVASTVALSAGSWRFGLLALLLALLVIYRSIRAWLIAVGRTEQARSSRNSYY
jgi:hypothetical protein